MNMFKKNGGFTLVELIVVIAILAILAAVAVPAYSGYISKAQDAGDDTALAAVKTAAMGALAKEGTVSEVAVTTDANGQVTGVTAKFGTANTSITLIANGAVVADVTGTSYDEGDISKDFWDFMNKTLPTLKGTRKTGATWTATDSKWK